MVGWMILKKCIVDKELADIIIKETDQYKKWFK